MKGKKILSAFIALVLIAGLPVTAFAADWNIDKGDITITADGNGQNVSQVGGESIADTDPIISGSSNTNTITIVADAGATANVTLDGVNIDVSDNKEAAISTTGEGNVTIELEGDSTVKSGGLHAGLEKGNDGNLTIKDDGNNGSLTATGGFGGAGIGGGYNKGDGAGNVSNITISGGDINATGGQYSAGIGGGGTNSSASDITISGGNVNATGGSGGAGVGGAFIGDGSHITISGGNVTAVGGTNGAGIGGGGRGSGSDVIISGDAQVKVKGGEKDSYDGAGSGIGNGGGNSSKEFYDGEKITPNTSELTKKGKIEYYDPNSEIGEDKPRDTITGSYVPPEPEQPTEPEQPAEPEAESAPAPGERAPLYRVTGKDGKDLSYKYEKANGVLTVTVEADYAVLTGSLAGINALSQQGIEELVFITNGATSTYQLTELLDMGSLSDSYALTHDGATATLAVG